MYGIFFFLLQEPIERRYIPARRRKQLMSCSFRVVLLLLFNVCSLRTVSRYVATCPSSDRFFVGDAQEKESYVTFFRPRVLCVFCTCSTSPCGSRCLSCTLPCTRCRKILLPFGVLCVPEFCLFMPCPPQSGCGSSTSKALPGSELP